MKRFIYMAAVLVAIMAGIVSASSFSTANTADPLPVTDNPITGFYAPATATMTIGGTAKALSTIGNLVAGTKQIAIVETGTDGVNYGSSAVGAGAGYLNISTGTTKIFNIDPVKGMPVIYFKNYTAGATSTLRIICIK